MHKRECLIVGNEIILMPRIDPRLDRGRGLSRKVPYGTLTGKEFRRNFPIIPDLIGDRGIHPRAMFQTGELQVYELFRLKIT